MMKQHEVEDSAISCLSPVMVKVLSNLFISCAVHIPELFLCYISYQLFNKKTHFNPLLLQSLIEVFLVLYGIPVKKINM